MQKYTPFQYFSLVILLFSSGCVTGSRPPRNLSSAEVRPVIAVMEFDNRSGFSGQWNLGSGMADLLVSELMASGEYRVVERQRIGNVLGEISLQGQSHFREEGRVNTGRLMNARYQIRGVITDFSQVRGGGFWVGVRRFFFKGNHYTAQVALTLTVVDVQSGEIIASTQSKGNAGASKAYVAADYKGVHFGGESFSRTPLGSATTQAIRSGLKSLQRQIPQIKWTPMIADTLASGRIILNGGGNRGYRTGDLYRVLGPVKVVTDPVSGDELTRLPGPDLGQLRILEVTGDIAIAEAVKGDAFPRGARIQLITPETF